MIYMMVAGLLCIFAPGWIMAACGMSGLENEAWIAWGVRSFGVLLIVLSFRLRYWIAIPKPDHETLR